MTRAWLVVLAVLVISACGTRVAPPASSPSSPSSTPASTSSNPKPNSQVTPFPA